MCSKWVLDCQIAWRWLAWILAGFEERTIRVEVPGVTGRNDEGEVKVIQSKNAGGSSFVFITPSTKT